MAKNVVAWVLIGIGLMMLAHTCSGCGSADVCDLGPPDGTPAVVELLDGDCGALEEGALAGCASRRDPDVCGLQWDCYGVPLEDGRVIRGVIRGGNVIGRMTPTDDGWTAEVWIGGELEGGGSCGGMYALRAER